MISVLTTAEEKTAIRQHIGSETLSAYIRRLITEDMAKAGKQFPNNTAPVGRKAQN